MRYYRQQRPYEQPPNPLQPRNIRTYFHQRPQNIPQHPIKDLAIRGMSGLNKTLNNVQSIVNVVERAAPVIEKYGPLMKNIPTMYKMLKAMQTEDSQEKVRSTTDDSQLNKETDGKINIETDQTTEKVTQTGVSTPKLFINE